MWSGSNTSSRRGAGCGPTTRGPGSDTPPVGLGPVGFPERRKRSGSLVGGGAVRTGPPQRWGLDLLVDSRTRPPGRSNVPYPPQTSVARADPPHTRVCVAGFLGWGFGRCNRRLSGYLRVGGVKVAKTLGLDSKEFQVPFVWISAVPSLPLRATSTPSFPGSQADCRGRTGPRGPGRRLDGPRGRDPTPLEEDSGTLIRVTRFVCLRRPSTGGSHRTPRPGLGVGVGGQSRYPPGLPSHDRGSARPTRVRLPCGRPRRGQGRRVGARPEDPWAGLRWAGPKRTLTFHMPPDPGSCP